jgi:hypothetical protein
LESRHDGGLLNLILVDSRRRTDREGGGARPRVGLSQLAWGQPGSKMVDATSDPKEQENRQLWIAL